MASIPSLPLMSAADIATALDTYLGGPGWRQAGGGTSVQDALTPSSSTVAPSVNAVVAGLAGKAATAHSHGAYDGTATGFVPVSGAANTTDFLRKDGTWASPPGGGGTPASQAEAEAGVENTKFMTPLRTDQSITARVLAKLLTGFTVGSNAVIAATDSILAAFGKIQAQINALISGKADLKTSVAETGTAWNITEAGHAYREVTGSNAAAITATFVFTGMTADNSTGVIRQGSAGVITLAGATVIYAPHLSTAQGNSPTTGSVRGWIEWVYRGGTTIEIVNRSEDDVGGGGGGLIQDVRNFTAVNASGAAGVEQTDLRVLNMAAITSANKIIKISGMFDAGDETADSIAWKVYIGSVLVLQRNFGGHRSYSFDTAIAIRALSGVGSSVTIALDGSMDNTNFNPAETPDVNVSAAWTVSVSCQKQTTNTRRATVQWLRVTVE